MKFPFVDDLAYLWGFFTKFSAPKKKKKKSGNKKSSFAQELTNTSKKSLKKYRAG